MALTPLTQLQFVLGNIFWPEKSEFLLLSSFINLSCRSMTIETFIWLYKTFDKPGYKITFIVSAAVVYCGSPIRSSSSAVVVKHPNDLHVTSYLPAAQTTEEYADILDDSEYSIICMN